MQSRLFSGWPLLIGLALPISLLPVHTYAQAPASPAATTTKTALVITGTVQTLTGEDLPGATVFIRGTYLGTSTDGNGRFKFTVPDAKPGVSMQLEASYVGYQTQTLSVVPGGPEVNVNLAPSPTQLTEVVVAASRAEQTVAEAPVTIERVSAAQINRLSTPDVLAGLAVLKGVDVSSASLLMSSPSTRGFNSAKSERVIQLTDYVDTQAPSLNVNAGNMLGIPEVDMESIDVLYGPSSALYGANAFNGVILFNSKDPFTYEGLTARVRGGSRAYLDGQFRIAKKITPRLAAKLNVSYLQANDFIANNFEAQERLLELTNNPSNSVFGANVVNRYGDTNPYPFNATQQLTRTVRDPVTNQQTTYNVYMPGFTERDLIADDNRTYSVRVQPTVSYLITDKLKVTAGYRFWQGMTTYQSTSRYRFKNLQTQQFFADIKSDKFFVRAYTTGDDGRDSYDLNFLGAFLQNQLVPAERQNATGNLTYANLFAQTYNAEFNSAQQIARQNDPNLTLAQAQQIAAPIAYKAAAATQLQPGTTAFNEARQRIITSDSPGKGAQIRPYSRLSDVSAQYQFKLPADVGLIVGGAFRDFRNGSNGRLFSDTTGTRIRNYEYGAYGQATKGFNENRLKLAFAARVDAFKNFDPAFSPRASVTYAAGNDLQHNFRVSYSRAFRSPTQLDQYLALDLGRAYLLGNVGNGFEGYDLAARDQIFSLASDPAVRAKYRVTLPALKLEQVNTGEIGYRAAFGPKVSLDLSLFVSRYTNFIGARRIFANTDGTLPTPEELSGALASGFTDPRLKTRVVQAWTNSGQALDTRGAAFSLNYALATALNLTGTYSYNELTTDGLPADFQTFFNTPKHKFSLAANGVVATHGTYSVSYRWAQAFRYEMPFAAGNLAAPTSVDVNLGYRLPNLNTTVQAGATNLLDTNNTQVYGAPSLGRIVFAGLLVEIK